MFDDHKFKIRLLSGHGQKIGGKKEMDTQRSVLIISTLNCCYILSLDNVFDIVGS